MSENKLTPVKKSVSADWLVRGVLSKIGETFDRLTGRNWQPSSSLATSELIEKLKTLLDSEAKDLNEKGRFVPHNIKLKMQWDKFSTDAENSLKKLEHELLTAAIDHINDRRYYTYAPMQLEIKPDYFTEGVKLLASFDKFSEDEREAAVNVSVPDLKNVVIAPAEEIVIEPEKEIYTAEFTVKDKTKKVELAFADRQRSSVGRTKENDLWIDDASVSKIHAALVLNSERQLMVADTGSTNGTFINGQRIAYGKAIPLKGSDRLKFGTVEVTLEHIVKKVEQPEIYAEDDAVIKEDFSTSKVSEITKIVPARDDYLTNEEVTKGRNYVTKKDTEIADNLEKKENDSPTESRVVLDFGENK